MSNQKSNPPSFILPEMSWPEVKEALKSVRVAVVPIGSQEQHGPHLATSCDTVRAREFSRLLAERLHPRVLVTPTVTFGVSYHHIAFPGTISLRPETLMDLVFDIVESLSRHGLKKFFLLNSHGGNNASLEVLVENLKQRLGITAATCNYTSMATDVMRDRIKSPVYGHSCEREVSEVLYLYPEIVRQDRLEKGAYKGFSHELAPLGSPYRLAMPYSFADVTENGALGDATLATRELGEVIVERALSRIASFIEHWMEK